MSMISGSVVASEGPEIIELEDFRPTPSTSQSNFTQDSAEHTDNAPLNATSLPPMDHGFDAWAYLVSAWLVELLVWSYPFSYGVFLNYYASHEFKDSSSTLLALVGSLSTGLIYLSSIVILPVIARYPARKKQMMYVGLCLSVAGLIGAAFSNTPEMLVLTQGVMYSIGGSFLYFPVMTYLFEWFSDKKGLANGLIFSGTGVGGVVMPIITEALLNKYGRKVTMLALATSFALLVLPAFPYIKPRVPISHIVHQRPIDTQFLKYHPFWVLFIANLVQGLGTFLPTLYLPTFATDLGLNNATSVGTWSLSLMNGASAPGLIFIGYLSDRFDLRISIFISALGSSLAVLFIWGFTIHIAPLLVFACIYGFLAPSWSAMWPRFISTVAGDDPHQASIMMGIFMAGRGVGNALSTPISSGLLHPWAFTGKSIFPYSLEGYGPLILFTGITLLVSTCGISYRNPDRTTNIAERVPRRFRRASISPP
ncbi:MFS general substrate transporter [Guyanagaster necrorhizus]|uniref:MFS general substrate transporter n=1 Tax=Guyanagaster necrorhizus TaxID=856835 RepID=A0A9P7VTF6_9AGAR|nr:MFS general substrate transporter [Guyanagaster necrorhizus MCA 3950]KAG7446619.1 MFS general substrate transporter [Guyanagaster necrorhizus MCA 3950]